VAPNETDHQEQVPRKQGLKQISKRRDQISSRHQEQVPRKQGLKPEPGDLVRLVVEPSRASSTKTRIETVPIEELGPCTARHQEQVPRKQGLKRSPDEVVGAASSDIKSKFHENKD